MRKILISFGLLISLSLIAFGATKAYFSDTEISNNNIFVTGTMDLNIDGSNATTTTITLSGKAPGDSGKADNVLKNSGSLAGELDISLGTIANYACTDATYGKNDGTEYCNSDAGALGANAQLAMYIDVDQDGTWNTNDIGLKSDASKYVNTGATALVYDTFDNYSGVTWDNIYNGEMSSGSQDNFVFNWKIPTNAGNEIQGDALKFGITFTLEQADKD